MSVLLCFGVLFTVTLAQIYSIGSLLLASILIIGIVVLTLKAATTSRLPLHSLTLFASSIPFLSVTLIQTLFHSSFQATTNFSQLVLIIFFVLGMSIIQWQKNMIAVFTVFLAGYYWIHLIWWFLEGAPLMFSAVMTNANSLGLFTYIMTFFPLSTLLINRKGSYWRLWSYVALLPMLIILFASTARSAWLGWAIAMFIIVSWKAIRKNRRRYFLFFYAVIFTLVAFTVTYAYITEYSWAYDVNSISRQYTGKNFISGRNNVWSDLLVLIKEKPWLGYGAGAQVDQYTNYDLSAHNLYLQLTLQVGIAGLISFFVFLQHIWVTLWSGRERNIVMVSSAYFISILVHQLFEVTLTQNNLVITFPIWLIIAIGLSHSTNSSIYSK